MFVLFTQTPNTTGNPTIRFIAASHGVVSLARRMAGHNDTVGTGEILVLGRFADDQAEAIRSCLERMKEADPGDDTEHEREQLEALLAGFLFSIPEDEQCEVEHDDPMDGDHESALASAGLGTDEDYGGFGNDYGDEF